MATLFPGQSLLPGQTLQSDYGVYTLTMQPDGNVVLRNSNQTPLWRTNTGGNLIDPRDFIMQTDGNLVLYDTSGQPHWESNTAGNPGAFLNVQADGNLVVYRAGSTTQTANNSLWASGTNVPQPITFQTVIDSGAMLNVGNANLTYLSYDMPFGPGDLSSGRSAPYTEQGSWSSQPGPGGCGGNTVTVNAHIEATWGSGPAWSWQQLQVGFAAALSAAMQAASNPTKYQNYSYTEFPEGDTVVCLDPQPTDNGYYIPQQITVTAHDTTTGDQAGSVMVTYSTDQSDTAIGTFCSGLGAASTVLAIFPPTAELAAVLGAVTGVACG